MHSIMHQTGWQKNILGENFLSYIQMLFCCRNKDLLICKCFAHHIHNLVRLKCPLKNTEIRDCPGKIIIHCKLRSSNIIMTVIFLVCKSSKPLAQTLICATCRLADPPIGGLLAIHIDTRSCTSKCTVFCSAHAHCHMYPLSERIGKHRISKQIPILKADPPEISGQKHIWSAITFSEIKHTLPDIGALCEIDPRGYRDPRSIAHPIKNTFRQFKI